MLSKTLIIALDKLKPKSITTGLSLSYAFDYAVCYYIRKSIEAHNYRHLTISYEYSVERIYHISDSIYEESLDGLCGQELLSFNYLLERSIEQTIEEFNIYQKKVIGLSLNFNSTIINGNSFILSSEILEISKKDRYYA